MRLYTGMGFTVKNCAVSVCSCVRSLGVSGVPMPPSRFTSSYSFAYFRLPSSDGPSLLNYECSSG